jgi:hypothetical protein
MKKLFFFVLVAAFAVASVSAELPDFSGEPLNTVELSFGFTPDPYTLDLQAGGSTEFNQSEDLSGDYFSRDDEISVSGYVYGAGPDVQLFYDAGSGDYLSFRFRADSSNDTFLLVNDPDGDWWIMDDSEASLDPAFGIRNPPSGRYDIWVGTWTEGLVSGTLEISELR